jgi:hypothetical protein
VFGPLFGERRRPRPPRLGRGQGEDANQACHVGLRRHGAPRLPRARAQPPKGGTVHAVMVDPGGQGNNGPRLDGAGAGASRPDFLGATPGGTRVRSVPFTHAIHARFAENPIANGIRWARQDSDPPCKLAHSARPWGHGWGHVCGLDALQERKVRLEALSPYVESSSWPVLTQASLQIESAILSRSSTPTKR